MREAISSLAVVALFAGLSPAFGVGGDPVFDVGALCSTPLNARTLAASEVAGIVTEEVMFQSETEGDRSIEIFAFFSYPKGARGLPAFVWNQGGLSPATRAVTEMGARRGYATLCIDFPISAPGYRSTQAYPITSGLQVGDDPRRVPIYHGAVALLKAVSYLESRAEVDGNRIGMAGSSWGGFYTTMMVGIDPRLKVGASMFGTGNLQLGCAWFPADTDKAYLERWRTTLDPAWRLSQSRTPIAWFTGTNDWFYRLPALMASQAMAGGPEHLTLVPNWNHALTPSVDEQVFAWLDVYLRGAPAFVAVSPLRVEKRDGALVAEWTYSGPLERKVVAAKAAVSYGDAGNWVSRCWKELPATFDGNRCEVELLASPMPYYVFGSVGDADGFIYSTPMVRVAPGEYGVEAANAPLEYDGCAEWGGFEDFQIAGYVRRHGISLPELTKDAAHSGEWAAILPTGEMTLPPILFTPGVPHRFECYLKADKRTQVTIRLEGSFDAVPASAETRVEVGTDWTCASLRFRPPDAQIGALNAKVSLEDESATVLLDDVSFRPTGTEGL